MFKPRHEIVKVEPRVAILVVSNSRFRMLIESSNIEDESGRKAYEIFKKNNIKVYNPIYIPNDEDIVRAYIKVLSKTFNANIIITIGGTGPSKRDRTVDAVSSICRELPGFGELFRRLSEERIGIHAIMSRAGAYICDECAVFCLPGSPDAVELAIEKIIIPIMEHLLSEIFR